jgi:WD40 repeat protein
MLKDIIQTILKNLRISKNIPVKNKLLISILSGLDYKPNSQLFHSCKKLLAHNGCVNSIIQLTSTKLASCSGNVIKIWNIYTYNCIKTISEHEEVIISLLRLKNKHLISYSDKEIRQWSTNKDFKCILKLTTELNIVDLIELDGYSIAYTTKDSHITIYNLKQQNNTNTFIFDNHYFRRLIQLENNDITASTSQGKIIIIHMNTAGDVLSTDGFTILEGHHSIISCLINLPGERFASGSFDHSITIYSLKGYKIVKTLRQHCGFITNLYVLLNGSLISTSHDKTIKVWNLDNYDCTETISFNCYHLMEYNEELLILGTSVNFVVYDRIKNKILKTVSPVQGVSKIIKLYDGRFVSSSYCDIIHFWNN